VLRKMIKWHLAELMARHQIKAKDLADKLGVNNNAISNLKASKTLPRIGGDKLDELIDALSELADPESVELLDLISHTPGKRSKLEGGQ
jgi:putative transcriptional regulator